MRASLSQWGSQFARVWSAGEALNPAGTDWALWKQACTGHQASASALVHRFTAGAYRLALQMLGKPEDAQDVVQESFMRLWCSQPSDAHGAQLSTYFNTIVINRCKSHLVRQRELTLDGDDLTELADDLQQCPARDFNTGAISSAQLQQALASLPARQRLALAMWAYGDAEVTEIAHTLRIDTNAAHQLLHRAKRSLRGKFPGAMP